MPSSRSTSSSSSSSSSLSQEPSLNRPMSRSGPTTSAATDSSTGSKTHHKTGKSSHHRKRKEENGPSVLNLRLILVSGKTKDFKFPTTESAGDIAQYVFDNWPSDWSEETVSSAEILRLIYQGRFLHGNVTLSALGLPTGKTTVMHLVPRESLPEPNSQDDEKKKKSQNRRCCSTCSLQ